MLVWVIRRDCWRCNRWSRISLVPTCRLWATEIMHLTISDEDETMKVNMKLPPDLHGRSRRLTAQAPKLQAGSALLRNRLRQEPRWWDVGRTSGHSTTPKPSIENHFQINDEERTWHWCSREFTWRKLYKSNNNYSQEIHIHIQIKTRSITSKSPELSKLCKSKGTSERHTKRDNIWNSFM